MINEKNAGVFLIIAAWLIFFIIISNIIGAVNFYLNDKRSLRSCVKLSDKISWLIPKYGGYHHSYGIRNYKIYKYTFVMGLINDILPIVVIIIAIILCYTTDWQVAHLCVVPAIYLVIVLISGLIVIKNCKPDPNPFH